MATESVEAPNQAITNCYVDSDHYEATDAALRAALALTLIIQDATVGENANTWASHVLDDLHTAELVILRAARSSLSDLWEDGWHANALLGKYGPEAKARAEAREAGEAHA